VIVRACLRCGRPAVPGGARCELHGGNRRLRTTGQRGYDWAHEQRRAALLPYAYGTACPLCGETMNYGQALDLDHEVPLSVDALSVGTRITHSGCNRRRRS
jgi:hypothetical protein